MELLSASPSEISICSLDSFIPALIFISPYAFQRLLFIAVLSYLSSLFSKEQCLVALVTEFHQCTGISVCCRLKAELLACLFKYMLIHENISYFKGDIWLELYSQIKLVPRSKYKYLVIKTIQLTLCREIIAVCSEIHTKHINTLCGQKVQFLGVFI